MNDLTTPAPPGGPWDRFSRGQRIAALIVAAVVVLSALLLVLLIGSRHTITGSISLFDTAGYSQGTQGCSGKGGYDDIAAGSAVTIADGSSAVLAVTALDDGRIDGLECVFSFTARDVPASNFYQIEVSHRGWVTFSSSELAADGWKADLHLGTA